MTKNRLEAFSDGVIAIIITIMVLELRVPHGSDWHELLHLFPVFKSYVLSFAFIAIYWGNHHHLIHAVHHVNSRIIWANTHLLFWLSLIPFATAWMGENEFSQNTVVLYALLMNVCGIAYYILLQIISQGLPPGSHLEEAIKKQKRKGMISVVAYTVAAVCAFFYPPVSEIIFVIVALYWVIPDINIEKAAKST